MEIKNTDLVSLFEQSLKDVPQEKLEEIGIVVKVGDNICQVHGLTNAEYNELIEFEIIRDKIPIYSVDVSYMITNDIGFIKISTFAKTTYHEFLKAVDI